MKRNKLELSNIYIKMKYVGKGCKGEYFVERNFYIKNIKKITKALKDVVIVSYEEVTIENVG